MHLLSRVAEEMYWLGRHLERLEGLARIVHESTNLLVDLPVDVESDWSSLLAITGAQAGFDRTGRPRTESAVVGFLLAGPDNPASLARTLVAARENMRVTRSLLPRSAWECLNRLHVRLVPHLQEDLTRTERSVLLEQVVESCQQLTGILGSTMTRDHAFHFCRIGWLVERIDLTMRVLDVRAGRIVADGSSDRQPPADRSPYEDVRLLGVLRCLAAAQMYHRTPHLTINPATVVGFVVQDASFPRSVAYCAHEITRSLAHLPSYPEADAAVSRLHGHICTEPGAGLPGLHVFATTVQDAVADLHTAVSAAYFRPEPAAAAPAAAAPAPAVKEPVG